MRWCAVLCLGLVLGLCGCSDAGEPRESPPPPPGEGSPAPSESSPPVEEPRPPKGKQLVGLNDVVIAVPKSWTVRARECGGTGVEALLIELFASRDGLNRAVCMSATHPSLDQLKTSTREKINGVEILLNANTRCQTHRSCSSGFAVPSQNVQVSVDVPWPIDMALATAIRDSVQLLPDGYRTVPSVLYLNMDDAEALLKQAGLQSDLGTMPGPHYATDTEPGAGSVVAEGSIVRVNAGDG